MSGTEVPGRQAKVFFACAKRILGALSPIVSFHCPNIMAAQSDSAHDVHFEKAAPIVVIDLFKRLRLEDAKIVYKDVYRFITYRDTQSVVGGASLSTSHLALAPSSSVARF